MTKNTQPDIYDPKFVENLFNKMSSSYGLTNYISSFGFTEKWRNQCINTLSTSTKDKVILDMMSGMGELWNSIYDKPKQVVGADISPKMNKKATSNSNKYDFPIEVVEQNILENELDDESFDFVISSFGLKTFNTDQLRQLSKEVARILKTGGVFSFVEISKPKSIFKIPFLFYLKIIIPIIGWMFMRNDNSYRFLGTYCSEFENCSKFKSFLEDEGLEVDFHSFFFGCATGVSGLKK
ncbi:MAG: class I SAM-dependent methyltransferase [Cytophagia bacterium]|nr:class I SAM-dependent methyltransferase [Cytophagia bacterium]